MTTWGHRQNLHTTRKDLSKVNDTQYYCVFSSLSSTIKRKPKRSNPGLSSNTDTVDRGSNLVSSFVFVFTALFLLSEFKHDSVKLQVQLRKTPQLPLASFLLLKLNFSGICTLKQVSFLLVSCCNTHLSSVIFYFCTGC